MAVTPSGRLTVRAPDERFVPEGTAVTDRAGRIHGRVYRVFGPVGRPYLSIRLRRAPRPADARALVGATLVTERE